MNIKVTGVLFGPEIAYGGQNKPIFRIQTVLAIDGTQINALINLRQLVLSGGIRCRVVDYHPETNTANVVGEMINGDPAYQRQLIQDGWVRDDEAATHHRIAALTTSQ